MNNNNKNKVIFVKCKEYNRKGVFYINTKEAFFEYEGHGDCHPDFIKKHCINLSNREIKAFKAFYGKEYNEDFKQYKRVFIKDL